MAELSPEDAAKWAHRVEQVRKAPYLLGSHDILACADQQQEFIVDQRLPRGAITMIHGAPGAKKSWLAYSLAVAVAQGRAAGWLSIDPFLTPVGEPAPVLIINFDNPRPLLGRRLKQMGLRAGDPLLVHSPNDDECDVLTLPEYAAELHAMATGLPIADRRGRVRHVPAALIVVDSLRDAHTVDENDSAAMAKVFGCFKAFRKNNAAVVILHHSTKAGGSARGSGAIDAACDCSIEVLADIATWTKHRGWALEQSELEIPFDVVDLADGSVAVVQVPRQPTKAKKGKS